MAAHEPAQVTKARLSSAELRATCQAECQEAAPQKGAVPGAGSCGGAGSF